MSFMARFLKCCKCGSNECQDCTSNDLVEDWYGDRDCSSHTYSAGSGCLSARNGMMCCQKTLSGPTCKLTVTSSLGTFNFLKACIQAEQTVELEDYDPFGNGIIVRWIVCISISGLIDNGGGNVTVVNLLITIRCEFDGCTTDPNCENITDWADGASLVECALDVYEYTGVTGIGSNAWNYCSDTTGGRRCVKSGGSIASSSHDFWSWGIPSDDPGGYPITDLYDSANHYNLPGSVSFEITSGGPIFSTEYAYTPCSSDPKCP